MRRRTTSSHIYMLRAFNFIASASILASRHFCKKKFQRLIAPLHLQRSLMPYPAFYPPWSLNKNPKMTMPQKKLHLCKCMGDLNKMVDEVRITTNKPNMLLNAGERLITEGKKWIDQGDEERAYLMYMRALQAFQLLHKTPEFQKDKYYKTRIAGSTQDALKKSDELSDRLVKRYALIKEAAECEARENAQVVSEVTRNISKAAVLNGVVKPEVKNVPKTVEVESTDECRSVHPIHLKNLLDQQAKRVLLIDTRFSTDYKNSHINHSNCICIPAELLQSGMSANKIESSLKDKYPESFLHWQQRGTFDRIILYDWNSTFENRLSTLDTLFVAMTQWDPETKYKNQPQVLQGGCRNLLYTYPQLMNHPANANAALGKYEENDIPKEVKSLDGIGEYPDTDFDDYLTTKGKSKTPSPGPANNSTSGNNNSIPPPPVAKPFVIDRSLKPKANSTGNFATPVTNGPITNGGGHKDKMPNGVGPGGSNEESKKAAMGAALDDLIRNTKDAVDQEKEIDNLQSKIGSGENDELMRKLLKQKEKEVEELQKVIKNKDENFRILQNDYDSVVSSKPKSTLPKIRASIGDSEIERKLKERESMNAYVEKLRAERKAKELKEKERELRQEQLREENKLPVIPGSGSNSPRIGGASRPRKQESATTFPTINSTVNGPGAEGNKSPLLRPMSQDATPVSYQKLKDEAASPRSNSLLKRSHSHPNIAQSLAEEDVAQDNRISTSQTPNFNRNLKPSSNARPSDVIVPSRARQFHAVNSTEKHRTGLKNLGNTCYMNSIMQCINHLPAFIDYFVTDSWKHHYRKEKTVTHGEITVELSAALKEMSYGHRSIALNDIKSVVGRYHGSFRGYDQQDSHEFLTILLDWLHEELNQVPKSPLKEQKNDGLSDKEAADKAWNDYCASNRSKITELFCGQQKSTVRCLSCSKESVTFEPFFNLSVPIPPTNKRVDIQQCIELYTTEEVLGWTCVYCKSTVKAAKRIDLWRLPPYLIIHLQRFYNDGWWKKRLTEVDFPVDNLDLTAKVKGSKIMQDYRMPRPNFSLQAVSNHYGSMDGGHYTAYCRQKNQWGKFDDNEVTSINPRDVVTPAAYILFYCNSSP